MSEFILTKQKLLWDVNCFLIEFWLPKVFRNLEMFFDPPKMLLKLQILQIKYLFTFKTGTVLFLAEAPMTPSTNMFMIRWICFCGTPKFLDLNQVNLLSGIDNCSGCSICGKNLLKPSQNKKGQKKWCLFLSSQL